MDIIPVPDYVYIEAITQIVAMKHYSTKKHSLYLAALKSFCTGFVARTLGFVERHVPIGYEDETGFHIRA